MSECVHLQLISWHDIFHDTWHYVCPACGKRATIPIMDLCLEEDNRQSNHRQANHAVRNRAVEIIGQAFGEEWRARMQQEADEWEAKEYV